ncbi:hypothetical protein [Falsirhodobacter halotolerans]|nr:hypothetical protein [Falsirhodobacter halotolerans]
MAGKLPSFEKVFGRNLEAGKPQTPETQQAMCNALAIQWGAVKEA